MQQGTHACGEEGELAIPEAEVQPQSHIALQGTIDTPEGIKVVLADLIMAGTTHAAHIQQGHIEAEVRRYIHIQEKVQIHFGVEGGTQTETAAFVNFQPVAVVDHTALLDISGVGVQLFATACDTKELLQIIYVRLESLVILS